MWEALPMLKEPISITAITSISSLGMTAVEVEKAYQSSDHFLQHVPIGKESFWVGQLSKASKKVIQEIRLEDTKYKHLDDSVLFAIYTARKAAAMAGWSKGSDFGINIGSSRGATQLFEKFYDGYLKDGKTGTLTSPTTTLGNIASWVGHDLQTNGPDISHSITCSTALHALLNGIAWINSGLTNAFMVGGSEAALTPFTIAQMKALKIYASSNTQNAYPCQALNLEKTNNTMVLGEGAAMACLERGEAPNSLARVIGIGYATEPLQHNVSISSDAKCFQNAMRMAMGDLKPEDVDVIVMHAPGTIKGDASENMAIEKIFCNKIPFLTTNKWKVGHTFGASGMLSLEMAILMLQNQKPISVPYLNIKDTPKEIQNVMVNAVGFGGNAVSILLSK